MSTKVFSGCYSAVLLPRNTDGSPDEAALVRQLEFLLVRRIRNFALNGATGEYPQIRPDELKRCLQIAKATLPMDAGILCGIGAASLRETLSLARVAGQVGVTEFLVLAPLFFPYAQDDLAAFVEAVAAELSGPCCFTIFHVLRPALKQPPLYVSSGPTWPALKTAAALLRRCARSHTQNPAPRASWAMTVCLPRRSLRASATEPCRASPASCPELILPLFANRPGTAAFESIAEMLQQFIANIGVLPTPWGLKAVAEARGIAKAVYPLPLSDRRKRQISELQEWFRDWIPGINTTALSAPDRPAR